VYTQVLPYREVPTIDLAASCSTRSTWRTWMAPYFSVIHNYNASYVYYILFIIR